MKSDITKCFHLYFIITVLHQVDERFARNEFNVQFMASSEQRDCLILYTYKLVLVNDGMKLLLLLLFVVKYVTVITTRVV